MLNISVDRYVSAAIHLYLHGKNMVARNWIFTYVRRINAEDMAVSDIIYIMSLYLFCIAAGTESEYLFDFAKSICIKLPFGMYIVQSLFAEFNYSRYAVIEIIKRI